MIPEMMEIIVKTLSKEREKTRELVEALVDSEGFLFTNDGQYKEQRSDIVAGGGNNPNQPPADPRDMRSASMAH